MLRSWLVTLAVLVLFFAPRAARADQPGGHTLPVAVLGFDSEEADDQADALTGAVRSRVRLASGFSLLETTQSLGMLTAGLKCQQRPNAECQQKIGEQIKADRYVWGIVSKGPTVGQVTAEVHLYQKGKPDVTLKESFSDNLRDPNDDKGIGKIALRIIERLTSSALGVIVVRAPELGSGEVVLDGEKKAPLANGSARLDAAPGSHSVEITSPSSTPQKRNVLVTAGKESVVDIGSGAAAQSGPTEPGKPFPTRKVIGGVAMGAGVVLGIVSVINLTSYFDDLDAGKAAQNTAPSGKAPCEQDNGPFCKADKDAKPHSTIAWVTGGVGVAAIGVGAFLFFTDKTSVEASATTARYKTRVTPSVGSTNGVFVTGSF